MVFVSRYRHAFACFYLHGKTTTVETGDMSSLKRKVNVMNLPTSLIKIRYAAGAMLAMSALLAVVLSISFSEDQTALGDGHTNKDKVDNAVSALETAVANPDKNLDDLITSAGQIDDVTWDHDDDRNDTENVSANISIVPTVSVIPPATNNNPTPTATPETVEVALASGYLGGFVNNLESARTAENNEMQTDLPAQFTALSEATAVTLSDATTATPVANNTLEADLKRLEFDLNFLYYVVGGGRPSFSDQTETFYNNLKGAIYTAFGLDENATLDTSEGVGQALAAIYTPATTGNNPIPDSGHLVDLRTARTNELDALAGIKLIVDQLDTAIGAAKTNLDSDTDDTRFTFTTDLATRAATKAEIAKAEENLSYLKRHLSFITGLDLTATAELGVLIRVLGFDVVGNDVGTDPAVGWVDTVAWNRLIEIRDALWLNNHDDLDDNDDGTSEELDALKTDATNHISAALGKLAELEDKDGKAAQQAAILELMKLLTLVDNLAKATSATDDDSDNLTTADLHRLYAANDKFWDLITALEAKGVDINPGGTDTVGANDVRDHKDAMNSLAEADVGSGLSGILTTAASNLSGSLHRTAPGNNNAVVMFNALKTGKLASALATAPTGSDPEITLAELAAALELTATTSGGSTTYSTDDFDSRLKNFLDLQAEVDAVDTDTGTEGVQPSTALDAMATALQNTLDNATDGTPPGKFKTTNVLVEAYRGATLEYNAYTAMAALRKALDDVSTATDAALTATNAVAKKALLAAYDQKAHFDSDTKAKIESAYNSLVIGAGGAGHAYAQQAAFNAFKAALGNDNVSNKMLQDNIADALKTQSPGQKQAQAMISKITASISNVTVSGGDKVKLSVKIYGLQDAMDQKLAYGPDGEAGTADDITFDWTGEGAPADKTPSIVYTAPSAPGSYDITASLAANECYHADAMEQMKNCTATFTVKVKRDSPPQPEDPAPVNPPPPIPTILTDGDGNNYEVFTPVEGGTFDSGDGYSITAASGDVPNNEILGVRMSDDGDASNAGMTHQRYTLAGNMYGIHVVDGTGTSVTSYQLDAGAQVCLPLPDALKSNISQLAMVTINSNGTLTVLSASVKIGASGTMVCGNISGLPASVAVGSAGAPDAIPTATPEPTPEPPDTGGSAPSNSNGILVWAILLGLAATGIGTTLALARRRQNSTR